MRIKHLFIPVIAATLALSACGGAAEPPAPPPAPTGPTQAEIDAARADSIAAERGSTEYNLALGSRRAEAVREFLSGFGISASVFTTTSFGEERPAVNRSDEAAWAQNRRVEFVITGGQIVTSEDN